MSQVEVLSNKTVEVTFVYNILDKNKVPESYHVEGITLLDCLNEFVKRTTYKDLANTEILVYKNYKVINTNDWKTTLVSTNDIILIVPIIGVSALAVVGSSLLFWGIADSLIILAPIAISAALIATAAYYTYDYARDYLNDLLDFDTPDYDFTSGSSTPTYSWSGASTMAREGIPIPIIYGKNMVGGNILAEKVTLSGTLASDTVFDRTSILHLISALGESPINGITNKEDCYINDVLVKDYTDSGLNIDFMSY